MKSGTFNIYSLMVEGWNIYKKHAYIGFVYIPARGCDLKLFVVFSPPKTDVAYLLFNKYLFE